MQLSTAKRCDSFLPSRYPTHFSLWYQPTSLKKNINRWKKFTRTVKWTHTQKIITHLSMYRTDRTPDNIIPGLEDHFVPMWLFTSFFLSFSIFFFTLFYSIFFSSSHSTVSTVRNRITNEQEGRQGRAMTACLFAQCKATPFHSTRLTDWFQKVKK